jgi:hypothetical protein
LQIRIRSVPSYLPHLKIPFAGSGSFRHQFVLKTSIVFLFHQIIAKPEVLYTRSSNFLMMGAPVVLRSNRSVTGPRCGSGSGLFRLTGSGSVQSGSLFSSLDPEHPSALDSLMKLYRRQRERGRGERTDFQPPFP